MAKKKVTLYLSEELVKQTKAEAERQDRSLSWMLQMAWVMSQEEIAKFPTVPLAPQKASS